MQTVDENIHEYYPLGQRTLFMMIFDRSAFFVIVLLALFVILGFYGQIPQAYLGIAINAVFGWMVLVVLALIITIAFGWLEYIHYGIFIDEKNVKIKKGFIAEETTGIPYRHIKDVRIERSLINQIFGMSNIVIVVSGMETDENEGEESTTFLPEIEKSLALHMQDLILRKAQVEQIDVLSGHDNIVNKATNPSDNNNQEGQLG